MMTVQSGNPHVDDGDLIRYVDGELTAGESCHVDVHLATCSACASRLDALQQQASRFSELVSQVEIAPVSDIRRARSLAEVERAASRRSRPHFQQRAAWVRAAAAILVAFSTVVGVSPLRAWVIERWHDLVDHLRPAGSIAPVAVSEDDAEPSVVSFVPAAQTFELRIEGAQKTGVVQLRAGDNALASAQVVGATGNESLIILPSGVRITNDLRSSASYMITVPASVRLVVVHVGETEPIIVPVDGVQPPWSTLLDLAPASSRLAPE
jgi:anti-sigma factor RsiW